MISSTGPTYLPPDPTRATQKTIVTPKPTQRSVVTQKPTQKPTQKIIVTPKPVVVKKQVDVQNPATQRSVQTTGYNYDKPAASIINKDTITFQNTNNQQKLVDIGTVK